jgi:hypothetical protein
MPPAAPAPAQLSLFDDAPAPAQAPPTAPTTAPTTTLTPAAPPAPPRAVAEPLPAPAPAAPPHTFRHPRAQREIRFGEHQVAYELRRARRRSIGFIVGPEGLSVSAPRWVGVGEVEAALREKERWILRKLQEQPIARDACRRRASNGATVRSCPSWARR